RAKTGVFTGAFATNPVNGKQVPVFVADYVLMGYGTGAIMAVPAEDERDYEFAQTYDLEVVRTVQPSADFEGGAWTGDGETFKSASDLLSRYGLHTDVVKAVITRWLESTGLGEPRTTYRLRDWLFSRERYRVEPCSVDNDEEGRALAM